MEPSILLQEIELVSRRTAVKLVGSNRLRRAEHAGWIKPAVKGGPWRAAEYVAADLISLVERIRKEGNPPLLPKERASLQKLRDSKSGTTLTELLGVVVIFIIFATVVSLSVQGIFTGTRKTIAEKNAAMLNIALEQYNQAGGLMTAEVPFQAVKPTSLEELAEAQVFCKLASSSLPGGPFVAPYQSPVISSDPSDFRVIWVSGVTGPVDVSSTATGLRAPTVEKGIEEGTLVAGHFEVVGPGEYGDYPEDVPGIVSLTRGSGCEPIMGGGKWGNVSTPSSGDGGTGGDAGDDSGSDGSDSGIDGGDAGSTGGDSGDDADGGTGGSDDGEETPATPPADDDDFNINFTGGFGGGGDDGDPADDEEETGDDLSATELEEEEAIHPTYGANVRIWSNRSNEGTGLVGSNMLIRPTGAILYWDREKHPSVQEIANFNPWTGLTTIYAITFDRAKLTSNLDIYLVFVDTITRENEPYPAVVMYRPHYLSTHIWSENLKPLVINPALAGISGVSYSFENLQNFEGPVDGTVQDGLYATNYNEWGIWGTRNSLAIASATIYAYAAPEESWEWAGDEKGNPLKNEVIGTGTIRVTYRVHVDASDHTKEISNFATSSFPGADNAEHAANATIKVFDFHKHWHNYNP